MGRKRKVASFPPYELMSLLPMFYFVFGNNNSGGLFSFYLFINLFFGCPVWRPVACVHSGASGQAPPEGLLRECCLLSASEGTSARDSQPRGLYLFLECDHDFSDSAPCPPPPCQPERFWLLWVENDPRRPNSIFSCGLWGL